MFLSLKNINLSFDALELFRDFNLDIPKNKISCILGPSGCGKSSLLNIINQSLKIDSGFIRGNDDMSISYIFQEPRLLPWKNVRDNIAYPLRGIYSGPKCLEIAMQYIDLVKLNGFEKYYPSKLSGGMRQRVSMARAFAYPSNIILMDEAFQALDFKLKYQLMNAFRKLWELDNRTVVFVTHDIDEALHLADEIILFSDPPVQIVQKFNMQAASSNNIKSEIIKHFNRD